MISVRARAPSNIALIKYMGKADPARNVPLNPSVSLTLSGFSTHVEIAPAFAHANTDEFPAEGAPTIGESGRARFLAFVARLREEIAADPHAVPIDLPHLRALVRLKTENTFPHSAGIASSASAFAALTLAFVAFASGDSAEFRAFAATAAGKRSLAALARLGSGSSTRSFEGPFVTWQGTETKSVPTQLPPLHDLVLLAGTAPKTVGSSEAHRRVLTSPRWRARIDVVHARHAAMLVAIRNGDLATTAEIAHAEFLEMHELFHTAAEPFTYWNDATRRVLDYLERHRTRLLGQAIFTMDAGPNLHCLVPEAGAAGLKRELTEAFPDLAILADRAGTGAEVLR